jgi:hypothetical protein
MEELRILQGNDQDHSSLAGNPSGDLQHRQVPPQKRETRLPETDEESDLHHQPGRQDEDTAEQLNR